MPVRTSGGITDFIHHHNIDTYSCDTQTTPSTTVSVLGLNFDRLYIQMQRQKCKQLVRYCPVLRHNVVLNLAQGLHLPPPHLKDVSPLKPTQISDIQFFWARQPPMGHGLLIHEVSRSHSTTHHSR